MNKHKTITCEEFKSKIENHADFILVDVLSPSDYQKAHIRGSINIPLNELETKANQWLNRNIDIIIYSASPLCKGAAFAQEILGKMGFRVWTIEGGLETSIRNMCPFEGDPNYKPHPIMAMPTSAQPKLTQPKSVVQPFQKPGVQQPQKAQTPGQQQTPKKKAA